MKLALLQDADADDANDAVALVPLLFLSKREDSVI